MSSGPLPTRLIFLSDLPTCSRDEKVRFLGCVSNYNVSTATLSLQHVYPASSPNAHVTAAVDVNIVLESLKHTDMQVGEWVNVMGYVQGIEGQKAERRGVKYGLGKGVSGDKVVKVQAVMLWSAGGVKVWEYEKALEMRKQVQVTEE
ncbi:MAG: hypothetical protein Q9209_000575 [Squamulea sp. 1 TL-2023]